MKVVQLIEGTLHGSLAPLPSPTEDTYHALWLEHELGRQEPVLMALLGGALADRLAWVFVAGYQATIRRVFPTLPVEPGWCSFVNTEDRSGTLPGTALTAAHDAHQLSGWKTWVATSDHVERLLVSARQGEVPFAVVRRDQAGVRITTDPTKAYLAEMSQGRVEFTDVLVPATGILGDERTFPTFRAAESAYVRAALNAFILSQLCRLGGPPSLISRAVAGILGADAILRLPLPSDIASVAIHGYETTTRALADDFETLIAERDRHLHALWIKDRRLIDGASAGIAARAEAALASLGALPIEPSD